MRRKIVFLPYDFDTAIGINNEGTLEFSYNLEDIYPVVREGRWTYDMLKSLSDTIYTDLDGNGVMLSGWVDVDGSTYYLSDSGAMLTGWQWFGDQCYYFDSSGRLARDTVVEGYYVDANGVWIQDAA